MKIDGVPYRTIWPDRDGWGVRIIDQTYADVIRIFEDITRTGTNGDYEASGNPGEYAVRILNSKDHRGTVNLDDPRLTRLVIGGTGLDFGVAGIFGVSQSLDRGNFDLSELGIFALDAFAAEDEESTTPLGLRTALAGVVKGVA